MGIELSSIERLIGYEFKDKKLLHAAFTHSSYVNEHVAVDNERIEFLGDSVLNFIVGERLYFSDPVSGEGTLSTRRAAMVSRAPLSRIVDSLGLIDYLRVGAGVNKSAFSDKARSDLFEALIGAVYADGGMTAARTVLDNIFFGVVVPERDYKSALQELAIKSGNVVSYVEEPCDDGFKCTATVGDNSFVGKGKTKRLAQIDAARIAIATLCNSCE